MDETEFQEVDWQEINWKDEWAKHAFNFHDGFAHIDFEKLGFKNEPFWDKSMIKLLPGPGFGDLSHPTTHLVLELMQSHVQGKSILDIGSGSGILSLGALAFGAKAAIGVDIDPQAVIHATQNACLNEYEKNCHFSLTCSFKPDIILMNMIRSEQKLAFEALPPICRAAQMAFTSGILKEDKKTYLTQTQKWGWKLVKTREKNGWLGFQFLIINS